MCLAKIHNIQKRCSGSVKNTKRKTDNQFVSQTKGEKEFPFILPAGEEVRACVFHPFLKLPTNKMEETPALRLVEMVETMNWKPVEKMTIPLRHRVSTFFGKGKLQELHQIVEECQANVVIIDDRLNPSQWKLLSAAFPGAQVLDRFAVILNIFFQRAQSREAKLQVELASILYQKSRLVLGMSAHYSQQRGGTGALAGAGEKQLEVSRRILAQREKYLKHQLDEIQKNRTTQRKAREGLPILSVVGYTNAGKSALVNHLTGAELLSKNQVFSSLEPHMKRLQLKDSVFLLSDTVGFISNLPQILYSAFRSTLEEVKLSNMILHVRDITHPETEYQKMEVMKILKDLNVNTASHKYIEVLNKSDLLNDEQRKEWVEKMKVEPSSIMISAKTGEGISKLLQSIQLNWKLIQQEAPLQEENTEEN